MKKQHFLTSLSGWLLLLGLVLPLSVQATDVVVADANGNELTYSYDTDDGPATFKAVKTYAADEAKAGRIIIADYVTDANNNSHEVKYISGRVGNYGNIVSIVFGQNIVAVGGADGNSDDAFYDCGKLESVTLNAKLEILGRYAFQKCPKLESINLEDCTNLTTMKYQCFQRSGLKTVTIPASVTTFDSDLFGYCPLETITFLAENVPNSMFSGYSKLTTLNLGPGVKTIGNSAFYNCDALKTLFLSAGVKEIGNYAFANMDSLKTVTIAEGSQLEKIGYEAFYCCIALEHINLEAATQLKNIAGEALYRCYELKSITFPASIETMEKNVLWYSNKIETITFLAPTIPADFYASAQSLKTLNIGPGVKSIGNNAFKNIKTLTDLNIDPAVSDLTIGNYAFSDCDVLETLSLPVGVKEIGSYAFSYIDSLKTVTFAAGSQLTTLVQNAFRDNPKLETINLEACTQLTSIGNNALYNCPSLRTLTIPASVETFGSGILSYTNNIETMTFLAASVPNDFYRDHQKLTTINIGAGVKRIGNAAFYKSKGLKHLNISNDVDGLEIGESAFSECDSLSTISLPAGVSKLENYAFYSIDCLTSITFAEDSRITEIPNQCFYYCWNLETITLPNSVQKIGYRPFWYCYALREVYFGTGLTEMDTDDEWTFGSCDKIEKLVLPGINYPFKRTLHIPSTAVVYVHPQLVEAYRTTNSTKDCRIMAIGSTTEYAVTTTAGGQLQTKVPENQAQYTLKLTVSGPLNGTDIDYLHSAFPLIEELNLKNAHIVSGGDPYHQWNVAQNGTATIETAWYAGPWETEDNVISRCMFYNMPTLRSLTMPKDATKIGEWAVGQDRNQTYRLKTIELPTGVTEIGQCAFQYTGIEEVTVPAGVTRLEQYTFSYCKNLKKAVLPDGITFIGHSCFSECLELLDVNIPANVETIDEYAFNNNQKRNTPIVFPATLKTIGHYAFRNNNQVKSVTFNEGLETIGSWAFDNCYNIESITLPSTVTTMYDRAFQSCDSITTFTFPAAITNVPEAVLYHCDKLQSVTLAAGTTSIAGYAFENCPQLATINLTEQTSLTSIGNEAFLNTGFTTMTLPNSITEMGWAIFQNCKKLESINVPTGIDYVPYDFCESSNNLRSVQMHDGIRTIRHDAFLNCDSLENIELNDQITSIEYQAFQRCKKLNLPKLPDALTNLEYQAFHLTSSFTTPITIPAGVTYIGDNCFNGSAIKGVVMHDGLTLGAGVFRENDSLCNVRLPQDLITIPQLTFYHCHGLKNIDLPETVTRIENNAFDLSGLESIELPENLNHIGNYAFASTNLRSFRMPDGFTGTDYGSYFLAYNYHLKTAHLGRNMDYTGYSNMSTFYRCDSLELLRLYTATPPIATSTGNFGFRRNCVLEVPEGSEENYRTSEYVWNDFKEIRGFFTGDELAEADFAVLKDIYAKLDSTKWKTSWDLADNHNPNGKWAGVSTAKRGSETSLIYGITDIDLSAMGLTGQLPESVFRLKDLKTLNLSYNHISGNAAEIIGNVPESKRAQLIDLNLRGNELTGDAYAIASALPQLTKLNLSYNQISDVSQVIDNTTLKDLNLEMQFVDWFTKQPVAAAADVAQDLTAGVPGNIEWPATFSYRHGNQDFGRNPSNLYRPYCTNINNNSWNNTYELAKTDGLWNIDTYSDRVLRAKKNQPVAYAMDWQTVILRFNWEDGDANADQTVDVTDLQSVVNFAFNDRKYTGQMFNYGDADCNGDNTINIIDIVGNVERVLAYTAPAPSRMRIYNKVSADANNVLSMEGTGLTLHNTDQVAALQLTVAGATQHDVSMSSDLKNRFSVAMRQADDGLRIVVYSSEGRTLQPGSHELLSGLPAGAVVTDVVLSDASAQRLGVTVEGNVTTGISQLGLDMNDANMQVYDLQGRRLDTDWQSLPTGVYVIRVNGKQYKVKK